MNEKNELALREAYELKLFDSWVEAKETQLAAKEQFEIIDYRLKKALKEIFEKYDIQNIKNDELTIFKSSGAYRQSWDDKKVEALIKANGENIEDYKIDKWVEGGIRIKYKEQR